MAKINRIEAEYRRLVADGRKVHRLFDGNPVAAGFHFPREILGRAYAQSFAAESYHPNPKGQLVARQAIAAYYERHGATADPEHILLTSGTSESFFYLFSLLAKPGDNILAPNPSYPLFEHIAHLTHVEMRSYRLIEEEKWKIDFESLQYATDHHTRAIILISPHNPTGHVATAEEIAAITAWANDHHLPLICDEVFSEFYFGNGEFPRPMKIAKPELCFTLNGISKLFALPQLKLGWVAVTGEDHRVAEAIDRLELTADTFLSTHIPIQEALPAIFKEGQAFLKAYRDEVYRRRNRVIEILQMHSNLRFAAPMGGFFVMAEVLNEFDEEAFVIRLMEEKGIFVHPGFFYDYEHGTHIIMSCIMKETELLRKVFENEIPIVRQ